MVGTARDGTKVSRRVLVRAVEVDRGRRTSVTGMWGREKGGFKEGQAGVLLRVSNKTPCVHPARTRTHALVSARLGGPPRLLLPCLVS